MTCRSFIVAAVFFIMGSGPAASAAEKVKFTVAAEAFTEQSVMGSVYHSATPSTSKTVCRQPPYSSRVECETVTEAGTSAFTTESVDHVVRSGSVVGNGHVYTVSCSANWSGSNCAALIAGSSYPAEIDNQTMWISYRSGKKLIKAKYDVIAVTAIVQAPASARANGQHPANWNAMSSQQQAWWLCRDDPERVTARCKMVLKESTATQDKPPNWNSMSFTEQAAWQERRITELEAALKTLQASEKTQGSCALPHPANWNTMNTAEQWNWNYDCGKVQSTILEPKQTPRSVTPPLATATPSWKSASNWDRIKHGMSQSQVVAILGQPTSIETSFGVTLFYRGDVPGSGFVSGNVWLAQDRVYTVNQPVF